MLNEIRTLKHTLARADARIQLWKNHATKLFLIGYVFGSFATVVMLSLFRGEG